MEPLPGAALFAVFLLTGAVLFYLLVGRYLRRVLSARRWAEVPCVFRSSEVATDDFGDTRTYGVEIHYAHQFAGDRVGTCYDFVDGTSSGEAAKQAIVARYPPGAQTVCYVNPAAPADAVLCRDFPLGYFLLRCILPVPFLAVGLIGLAVMLFRLASG